MSFAITGFVVIVTLAAVAALNAWACQLSEKWGRARRGNPHR